MCPIGLCAYHYNQHPALCPTTNPLHDRGASKAPHYILNNGDWLESTRDVAERNKKRRGGEGKNNKGVEVRHQSLNTRRRGQAKSPTPKIPNTREKHGI
jgi:hypothetical protein